MHALLSLALLGTLVLIGPASPASGEAMIPDATRTSVGSGHTMLPSPDGRQAKPPRTMHAVVNLGGAVAAPKRVGFNVFDANASLWAVNRLPRGVRALVWLGEKCPTKADAEFRRSVSRLARNPKVYAYYLSDEPHIEDCPGAAAGLKSRARFIRKASDGKQRSFVVLSREEDYRAFRPKRTGLSLIGLNPYPCSQAHPHCEVSKVGEAVRNALRSGIPRRAIVPVFQAFGQENLARGYYHLPPPSRMKAILAAWKRHVPHPRMDYTYSWGNQGSANPTLTDSRRLQSVMRTHFVAR